MSNHKLMMFIFFRTKAHTSRGFPVFSDMSHMFSTIFLVYYLFIGLKIMGHHLLLIYKRCMLSEFWFMSAYFSSKYFTLTYAPLSSLRLPFKK